jgi:hypothetical protein
MKYKYYLRDTKSPRNLEKKKLNFLRACSDLYAHAEHTGQELMRTLSVDVRN